MTNPTEVTKAATPQSEPLTRWAGDHFGRQQDSRFLSEFLVKRVNERKKRQAGRSYVLNIDAGWGVGKTFFMERFAEDLSEHHSVAFVNAWEDDHADDPLIAIMVAIQKAFVPKRGKLATSFKAVRAASGRLAVTLGKHLAISAAKRLIDREGINALSDAITEGDATAIEEASENAVTDLIGETAEAALKEFEITKATIAEFKEKLRKLVALDSVRRPVFILIDELDRCRPSYAVALLERIKHLFDVEDLVFVVATDTEQLRHAVTAVYGVNFNGQGYLLRFFDRTYRFARPDAKQFIAAQFDALSIPGNALSSPPNDDHIAYFAGVARAFDLSPREIDRSFDILRSAITMWPYHQQQGRIELSFLLPLIVAQVRADSILFDSLAKFDISVLQKRWAGSDVVLPVEARLRYQRDGTSWDSMSVYEGTLRLIERATKTVGDTLNVERRPDGTRGWAHDRFREEAERIHSSRDLHRRKTVLTQYPELVRSVGQLTPAA